MSDERNPTQAMAVQLRGKPMNTDDLATGIVNADQIPKVVVGHLTIVEGPGAGTRLPVHTGTNAIGRDPAENGLVVDFGDPMISRKQHAFVTYDPSAKAFALRANGHPNPIHLNGLVVADQFALRPGDKIRIGQTVFQLSGA